jgi:1,4-dihydroxy-2-naphthoate polyprenyltransferase
MAIMNLLDYKGDQRVGKRTLVVILGPRRILHVHAISQAAAYVSVVPAVLWAGMPLWVGLAVALTLPLAVWHTVRLYRGAHLDPRTANSVPFWASTHSVLVVVAAYVGLLLDAYRQGTFEFGGSFDLFLLPPAIFAIILARQIRKNRPRPDVRP